MKVQLAGVASVFTLQPPAVSSTGSLTVDQRSPTPFLRMNFQSRRATETSTSVPACRVPAGVTATTSRVTGLPASAKPVLRGRRPA